MAKNTIKRINPTDWEKLLSLSRQTFTEAYGAVTQETDLQLYLQRNFTPEKIEAQLAHPQMQFFAIEQDGEWIGYAKLRWDRPHEHFAATKAMELERLYLVKSYWNSGLGSMLLDYCLNYTQQHDFEWIWLLVWNANTAAIRFYERWGFEHFGFQSFEYGNIITNDWLMKRRVGREK